MADAPKFGCDLYRGTAGDYERFRLLYPRPLVDDLLLRVRPSGHGRLLDLGCGTGQLTFALLDAFVEAWAVDQEPEMIEVVQKKAIGATTRLHAVASAAEDLDAPSGAFELITAANAFHRFGREAVAARARRWLQPGGYIALVWAASPWAGTEDWQRTLSALMNSWKARSGAERRVPAGWRQTRQRRSDVTVLEDAGFEYLGSFQFSTDHAWSVDALVGFMYSTSVLSRAALGADADTFADDLHRELSQYAKHGSLRETISVAYHLARQPPS